MRRIALLTAFTACLFTAAPGFAFEVQSGGVPLSAESVALLASRMAGLGGPAQQQQAQGGQADSRRLPPWMAGRDAKAAEKASEGAAGKTSMMGFMLGDRRAETKGFAARR